MHQEAKGAARGIASDALRPADMRCAHREGAGFVNFLPTSRRIAEFSANRRPRPGDRIVYVGLGAEGAFEEASGARYALQGTGTEPMTATLTGNGTIEGDGWTFTTELHPDERSVTVIAR